MLSFVKVFLYANLFTLVWANLFRGDGANTRIIGGQELEEDSAPYSVSLMESGSHFCGGAMLTDQVVITAAHCLGGSFSVLVGRHDFDDKDGELISVSKQIPHPKYDEETSEFDMALLVLSKPVTNAVQVVTLNDDPAFPSPGQIARVMGWGNRKADGFDLPDVPHFVDVDVISNQQCEDMERDGDSYGDMKYPISDDMICTYTANKDSCQGDSGGPLIVKGIDASQDKLIGVVSWGVGCAYLPGVYGRVSQAYDWIKEEACAVSDDDTSGSSLCGTRSPTLSPTTSAEPTVSPSDNPTSVPSSEPSAVPSLSVQPTEMPSSSPSLRPSGKPSASPSTSPSSSPTTSSQPTSEPTSSPSDAPSASPSLRPSNSPSLSTAPTQSPAPSSVPTKPKLLNTGDSLIINAMKLVDDEGNVVTNDSSAFGNYAYIGSLTSFLISAWLFL
eukprot:scaffold3678_cov143-Skeletonema_menzelii.AAC.7